MDEIIDYVKQFLLYGNQQAADSIGYTRDEQEWSHYKLVIVPGKNILTGEKKDWAEPDLSVAAHAEKTGEFTDEFGEKTGGTWVIREDIIYNTLYCISLAGEQLNRPIDDEARDAHGRIPSDQSPLGRLKMWTIPVVDEYARLCTKLVEAPLPGNHFSHIVLSHDVDTICQYRHLRGFLGGIARGHIKAALGAQAGPEFDPAYTFPWLHDLDKQVSGAEEIYFLKAGRGKGYDYPQYDLQGSDFAQLTDYLLRNHATIGLHGSYEAAETLAYDNELNRLEVAVGKSITTHRNHYLRIVTYEALQTLADGGITDDYTIGWADHVGFRLATTRPVRWINPVTMQLTNLTLHPLCIMDCTLSSSNYMNIQDEEEAYYICQQVIDKVKQHGGELVLLWHNSNITDCYHQQLYKEIIDYLKDLNQ